MSQLATIKSVTEIVGDKPHITVHGYELSSVYYDAVNDYHQVVSTSDFEAIYNYKLSPETADKVKEKILILATKLNNGERPHSLKVLPANLYKELSDYELYLLGNPSSLVEGSQNSLDYATSQYLFQNQLIKILAEAYQLPHWSLGVAFNNMIILTLVAGSEKAAKKLSLRSGIMFGNMMVAPPLLALSGVGAIFSHLDPVVMAVCLGATTVSSMGMTFAAKAEADSPVMKYNFKKKKFPWMLGGKKNTRKLYENLHTLIEPQLDSMKNYLLQESPIVKVIETSKRNF